MKITVAILTRNEGVNIINCIKSVEFADEILVIDDNSSDETRDISKKLNAKVLERNLNDDYASQRNYGLKYSKGEWVLFIDADERVSKALKEEIINFIYTSEKNVNGAYIKRRDYIWGKEFGAGEIGNIKLLRLAKKGKGIWKRRVHEVWDIEGETKDLRNPILHYPHLQLKDFLKDINRYSDLHAKANYEEDKRSDLFKMVFYPIAHFIKNYIFHRGFHDGIKGLIFALVMSFHSYLSWSKLWLFQKRE